MPSRHGRLLRGTIRAPRGRGLAIDLVRTTARTGRRAIWNTTNPEEVRAVAGPAFLGTWESSAIVMGADGTVVYMRPGSSVIAWDDGGMLHFRSAVTDGRSLEVTGQEAPPAGTGKS